MVGRPAPGVATAVPVVRPLHHGVVSDTVRLPVRLPTPLVGRVGRLARRRARDGLDGATVADITTQAVDHAADWATMDLVERAVLARSADGWDQTRMLQPRVDPQVLVALDGLVQEVFVRVGSGVERAHVLRPALEDIVPALRTGRSTDLVRVTVRVPSPLVAVSRDMAKALPARGRGGGRVSALAAVAVMRAADAPVRMVRRFANDQDWSETTDWQLWLPRDLVEAAEARASDEGIRVGWQVAAGLRFVTEGQTARPADPEPTAPPPREDDPIDFDVMDDDAFDAALAEFDDAIARTKDLLARYSPTDPPRP